MSEAMATVAARTLLRVLALTSVLLLATGVWLFFLYRPTAADAWPGLESEGNLSRSSAMRWAHRWLSVAWVVLVVVATIRSALDRCTRSIALLASALILSVVAAFTGYLLPWDRLALAEVAVGSNLQGYLLFLFDDNILSAQVDGVLVSVAGLLGWLFVHLITGLMSGALAGVAIHSHLGKKSQAGESAAA